MQRLISGLFAALLLLVAYGIWRLVYRLVTGSWTDPEDLIEELECED